MMKNQDQNKISSPWMTIHEAADYLPFRSKSRQTRIKQIVKMVREGRLPAYKLDDPDVEAIPRNYCFLQKDLNKVVKLLRDDTSRAISRVNHYKVMREL